MKKSSPFVTRFFFSTIGVVAMLLAYSQDAVASSKLTEGLLLDTGTKERATAIVTKIKISSADKQEKIHTLLSSYFDSLDKVFRDRKAAIDGANRAVDKELADARKEKAWAAAAGKLNKLHATFLGKLSSLLTTEQIEKIKDGMTEDLLHVEYRRFLDLLPHLKEQHKTQIMVYLVEARENAMDAETKDMRKQWFIKYRGRANNYLAAAGYDLRKATEDLEEKNKEKK